MLVAGGLRPSSIWGWSLAIVATSIASESKGIAKRIGHAVRKQFPP